MKSKSTYNIAELVEKVKDITAIDILMADEGIELTLSGSQLVGYHSNRHGSKSEKSLSVDPVKGIYYCFHCGEGGDVINWIMNEKNMHFMEALDYLARKAGIDMPMMTPEEKKRQNALRQEQNQLRDVYNKAAMLYHSCLDETGYELLLKTWGITKETAQHYLIGFAPGGKNTTAHLIKLGFSVEAINSSGLVNRGGFDFFQKRLIFPYWNNGKVVYFAGRRIEGVTPENEYEVAKYKKIPVRSKKTPHISEAVTNNHFVGADTLRGAKELVITEGITDCYAAIQAGFACISPATVTFKKDDLSRLVVVAKKVSKVYICNDSEANGAGENGALSSAQYLDSNGVDVRIITLPRPVGKEKTDLAEFLRDNSPKDLQALFKTAYSLTELTLEQLKEDLENSDLQKEAISRAAHLDGIEKDRVIEEIFQVLRPLSITKNSIRKEVEKIQLPSSQPEAPGKEKETQAEILLGVAGQAELFHNQTGDGYARISVNSHKQIRKIKSKFFRQWLIKEFYTLTGKPPSSDAVNQAILLIEAMAVFDGPKHQLHLRAAEYDGAYYYDLANKSWQAIKITADGWDVVDPPILFERYKNTAPQVMPERGGDLNTLKKYINLSSDEDWILLHATNAFSYVSGLPHPVPIIYGDKGAAKTTTQRVLRVIIDPAHRDTMTLPTDKAEFALMLMTNYAPAFDNLDGLQAWQSDMLCQAVTGGGISKRELYSDTDEVILSFLRCPSLNGINIVASRDDLLDRAIIFKLARIVEENRKAESDFWSAFQEDLPYILGAYFDVISKAMRILPDVKLDRLPRMADFARWGYAISEAISPGNGSLFMRAYKDNIASSVSEAVMADIVSAPLVEFITLKDHSWTGTASELLDELGNLPSVNTKERGWPKRPHTLVRRINKMKSALADIGISIDTYHTGTERRINITSDNKKVLKLSEVLSSEDSQTEVIEVSIDKLFSEEPV